VRSGKGQKRSVEDRVSREKKRVSGETLDHRHSVLGIVASDEKTVTSEQSSVFRYREKEASYKEKRVGASIAHPREANEWRRSLHLK
jgi:hypothetical protein